MTAPPSKREIVRADSHPVSLIATGAGALALVVVLGGGAFFFISQGLDSPLTVTRAMKSSTFLQICLTGAGLGAIAVIVGASFYRWAKTKTARSQSISGMVLGAQGILAALVALYFVQGDMATFTRNFVNFPDVVGWAPYFLSGMGNTLILTGVSTVFGIVLGLVIALFLISTRRIVRAPARIFVNIFRGTPILVQLSIIYFGLALGLHLNLSPGMAMIVTLSLNASAYMAEVFRAGLQSIERSQLDAARGLGLNYGQSLLHVIIPQATRRVIPPLMNDFINITKETSLIAFVGVSLSGREMYTVATQGYSQFFNSTFFVAAAAGYLIITLPLIGLVNYVERRVRSGLVSVGG